MLVMQYAGQQECIAAALKLLQCTLIIKKLHVCFEKGRSYIDDKMQYHTVHSQLKSEFVLMCTFHLFI